MGALCACALQRTRPRTRRRTPPRALHCGRHLFGFVRIHRNATSHVLVCFLVCCFVRASMSSHRSIKATRAPQRNLNANVTCLSPHRPRHRSSQRDLTRQMHHPQNQQEALTTCFGPWRCASGIPPERSLPQRAPSRYRGTQHRYPRQGRCCCPWSCGPCGAVNISQWFSHGSARTTLSNCSGNASSPLLPALA